MVGQLEAEALDLHQLPVFLGGLVADGLRLVVEDQRDASLLVRHIGAARQGIETLDKAAIAVPKRKRWWFIHFGLGGSENDRDQPGDEAIFLRLARKIADQVGLNAADDRHPGIRN